ncbi:MAG: glycosyltransferase family 4 protein [Acetobacteraceae bacterium]|nr:glycosyltransferase family 4 protein [Acetobacteraceae bacterium]
MSGVLPPLPEAPVIRPEHPGPLLAGGPMPAAGSARRVLVLTHSHPAITRGGAELAALRLFEGLRARPDITAFFLGCGREPGGGRAGSSITQPFGDGDFLYTSAGYDWFKFANHDERFPRDFAELLRRTRPDVLHFHHYCNLGAEALLIARRTLPHCRIVLTLHEFQAICHHYGQMITRQGRALCYRASPRDCTRCFPEFSRADFFLRRQYVQRFLELVDLFIAPSRFLAERYIAWGLPEARMTVLENVIADAATPPPPPSPRAPDQVLRAGFFGQISFLKGIQVLLDAAAILEDEGVANVVVNIHGDHTGQPEEFQEEFLASLARAGRNVRFHGPYDNQRVDGLMRSCDVVVAPSIWWENSPVVIQEARRNRVPIICSDIGGMAEKVRPGLDGWQIPVGSAPELAALLRRLAGEPQHVAAMRATIAPPAASQAAVAEHLAAYDALFAPADTNK